MNPADQGPGVFPEESLVRPLKVAIRPVFRPYLGGHQVRRLRGLPSDGDDHWTEEWVGSTVPAGNKDPDGKTQGLTVVSDRVGHTATLRDVVQAYPEAMLGEQFLARYGASPGFVVKIISLGQSGPFHAHPDAEFAQRYLDRGHGQAEAWILLGDRSADEPPVEAGVGFRPGVGPDDVLKAMATRSSEDLRALLTGVHVRPGDSVLVRPGTPHYLGTGPLFLEVQQPSDFSIVPEYWSIGVGEEDASLSLGWERALRAFHFEQRSDRPSTVTGVLQSPRSLRASGATLEVALLEPAAGDLFDVRRLDVAAELDVPQGRFAITIITAGDGDIVGDWGREHVGTGDVFAMPATLGHRFVAGRATLQVHRCMGPVA